MMEMLLTKHRITNENTQNYLYIEFDGVSNEIELDGIIDLENIQILINALTQIKNDFGGK